MKYLHVNEVTSEVIECEDKSKNKIYIYEWIKILKYFNLIIGKKLIGQFLNYIYQY